jgi:hypothetical protein
MGEEGCLGQEVAQLRKDKRRMVQTLNPTKKKKTNCKRLTLNVFKVLFWVRRTSS